MGQKELEAALRRSGDSKAREIWQAAEAAAFQLRSTMAENLGRMKLVDGARLQAQIFNMNLAVQTAAEQRAQRCRLEAETALSQRLLALAGGMLDQLAVNGGAALFHSLAEEIPVHPWQQVRVNRRDQQLAGLRFPEAEISVADDISAGLEVQTQDGRIQVSNTLEKRLLHLWKELLPDLMAGVRRKAGEDASVN